MSNSSDRNKSVEAPETETLETETKTGSEQVNRDQRADEQIFEELEKKKKKKKKKLIITIVCVVLVVALAVLAAVYFLRQRVNQMTLNVGDVTSATATTGSISTTVSGYGTLANCNEDEITVPANVTVEEVVVSNNDAVKEGEILAKINMASVMSAMSTVQDELDDLDDEIETAESKYIDSYITAGVYGRIKKLNIAQGDSISDVMYTKGAVALVSIDGYMAFDVVTDTVKAGDTVKVLRDDEKATRIDGTVEIVTLGVATILVKDSKADYGEKLTLLDSEGNAVGSGEARIHNQLKITGTQGTVSYLCVNEGTQVYPGSIICYLTDLPHTGNYNSLIEQRKEKEDELNQLIKIYKEGALTAPYTGRVSAVNYDEDSVVEGEETSVVNLTDDQMVSVTINVDEANILALEIGQEATVQISSIGDDEYEATLTEINKTATSSSGVTKYTATVELKKEEKMIAGMTASVVIRIEGVENAVIIPLEALHQTSSTSYVYTTFDETTGEFGGRKDVTVGIQNSSYVEITSGLNEGDTVFYTETQSSAFPSMGGNMPGGNGEMPEMPQGGFPSGGSGGPGGNGGPPSGGFPGGGRN